MPTRSKKRTILIVEDEIALSRILKEKFAREGYEVLLAANGVNGLEMALKKKPDIILLDIIMPRMDGLTMLKKLRSKTVGKTVPVIILTNLSDGKVVESRLARGDISDYLVKSDWSLESVVKRVRERINS